jgi:hypothetical protein
MTTQHIAPALSTTVGSASSTAATDERRMLFGGVLVGVAYLAATAFVAVFFATSHPAMDVSPLDAAREFHDVSDMVAVGTWLTLLPLPFALLFFGGLTSVLHRVAGLASATVALLGGVATFLLVSAGAVASSVTPTIGADDTSAAAGAVVKALDGVMPLSVAASGFPRAVVVVVVALALARAGLAGRGLTGFSWVLTGLSLLGTGTLVAQGFFPLAALSMLLFAGWIASVAVTLRRRLAA